MGNPLHPEDYFPSDPIDHSTRRSRGRWLLPLLLLGIGLIAGLWLGSSAGWRVLQLTGELETGSAAPSENQRNILVVGATDLSAGGRLVSVWLILYHKDHPTVNLFPLYPSSAHARLLSETFSITPEGRLHPRFLEALKAVFDVPWEGYVLLDNFAMIEIVDFFGGGGPDSASRTVGSVTWPWQDLDAALADQASLLHGLCRGITPEMAGRDLSPIRELHPEFLTTNLSIEELEGDWIRLITQADGLSCDFPSLVGQGP